MLAADHAPEVEIRVLRPGDDINAQLDLAERSFGVKGAGERDRWRQAVSGHIADGRLPMTTPLSVLHPATMPLYRSLGWELAGSPRPRTCAIPSEQSADTPPAMRDPLAAGR